MTRRNGDLQGGNLETFKCYFVSKVVRVDGSAAKLNAKNRAAQRSYRSGMISNEIRKEEQTAEGRGRRLRMTSHLPVRKLCQGTF